MLDSSCTFLLRCQLLPSIEALESLPWNLQQGWLSISWLLLSIWRSMLANWRTERKRALLRLHISCFLYDIPRAEACVQGAEGWPQSVEDLAGHRQGHAFPSPWAAPPPGAHAFRPISSAFCILAGPGACRPEMTDLMHRNLAKPRLRFPAQETSNKL